MKFTEPETLDLGFDVGEPPEGWELARMGEITAVVGGGTPKTSEDGNFAEDGYPWITPADLSDFDGIYISRGRRNLSEKGLHSCSATMIPKGAVLMSSRAPIGYVAVATSSVSTNQGFKSFICHRVLRPEYVFFWLKFIGPHLEHMGSGSTFLEISGSRARQIPILFAPTVEQQRIVAKAEELLARVNAARERLARVPAILKRFRRAILAAACSGRLTADWRAAAPDLGRASILVSRLRHRHPEWLQDEFFDEDLFEIPDSWQWVGLGSLGETVTGNTPPKKDQRNFGGDVPFFKPTELDAGYSVVRSIDSLTQRGARLARLVPPRTVMVTCIGATIGKTGFSRVEAATNQQINSVVTDPDTVSPEWLFFVVSSPWVQGQIRLRASETTLPLLNKGRFQKLPIPLPPAGEQHEIVRRVEALFKLADAIEKRVATATARAEKLTQAILAKAFRGELVPTEAELARREGRDYEPASALLARIRAERAAPAGRAARGPAAR